MEEEKELMIDKLEILKAANENLKIEIVTDSVENEPINLLEELEDSKENIKFVSKFDCDLCGKTFVTKRTLMDHRRTCKMNTYHAKKTLDLERNFLTQKLQVEKAFFKLKEKELVEKASCKGKKGCRIFHIKHNWYKLQSRDLLDTFENLNIKFELCEKLEAETNPKPYSCDICNLAFETLTNFNNHNENSHIPDESHDEPPINEDDDHTEKDSNKQQNKEMENVDRVIKNLCTTCLLSFKTETELKQHISKHSDLKEITKE